MALPAIVTGAWIGSRAHEETADAAQTRALALVSAHGQAPRAAVLEAVQTSAELVAALP